MAAAKVSGVGRGDLVPRGVQPGEWMWGSTLQLPEATGDCTCGPRGYRGPIVLQKLCQPGHSHLARPGAVSRGTARDSKEERAHEAR